MGNECLDPDCHSKSDRALDAPHKLIELNHKRQDN